MFNRFKTGPYNGLLAITLKLEIQINWIPDSDRLVEEL